MSVNLPSIQEALASLVQIPSVSGHKDEIQKAYDYVASLFPSELFDVHYVEYEGVVSQVIAFKGVNWKKTKLLLNGHIDVIPAPAEDFVPKILEGRMYARGTADMKSGIVAMAFAMLEAAQSGMMLDCAMLLNSDEEVGGTNGAAKIAEDPEFSPGFIMVADGPRYDEVRITAQEKGVLWTEVKVQGKAAHGARPWLGENALEKLLVGIKSIKEKIDMDRPDEWATTATLTRIETSNPSNNRVPDDARAVFDIRYTEQTGNNPQEAIAKVQQAVPEFEVNMLVGGAILNTDPNHPYVQKVHQIGNEVLGREFPIGYGHAASDARYFASRGLSTVLVGALGANWHAPEEWVDLSSVEQIKDILARFLKDVG